MCPFFLCSPPICRYSLLHPIDFSYGFNDATSSVFCLLPSNICLTITSSYFMHWLDLCYHQYISTLGFVISSVVYLPLHFFSLLDHRYGRSSFIIALYWRSGLGMFCRNLYFLVQVQWRWVEISRKFVQLLSSTKNVRNQHQHYSRWVLPCPPILLFFIEFN